MRRRRFALAAACAGFVGVATAQDATLQVRIDGGGGSRSFTREQLQQLPAETATATRRDGSALPLRGVSVFALLRESGLDLSANLGGGAVVRRALVARAADGYTAVYALAEIDPHFGHPQPLVVWAEADGRPLPANAGPLQLIHPGERRPGRWVRQLQSLEVITVP